MAGNEFISGGGQNFAPNPFAGLDSAGLPPGPEEKATRGAGPKKNRGRVDIIRQKAGRGGKTVTVVDDLPANADYLKDLARKLKTGCGCGGTHAMASGRGTIEIQGDQRPRVREILQKEGMRFKG